MARLRVLTVIGTRPEVIKLAPVIMALRATRDVFEPIVCVTGQHREMVDQVMADFELRADHDLRVMTSGQTLSDLSAAVVQAVARVLDDLHPDVVLVQGDTTSAAMAALAAFYARIPVGHVEAGLRTGDLANPFPEEANRRLISVLARWHYAPTATAVAALVREGIPADAILQTGNTVVDALHWMSDRVQALPAADGRRLILVTAHRRESFGQPFEDLCMAVRDLVERHPEVTVSFPVHLNPNVREPVERILGGTDRIDLREPASYRELTQLLKSCHFVLTDSGGIQEEAPALGKPVLVLRSVTERPEAVAAGTVKIVGTDRAVIVREAERLLDDPEAYRAMSRAVSPYGDGRAAERIAAHLKRLIPKKARAVRAST